MPSLNVDEYGQVLTADFGQDVSAATSYRFIIQPKFGRSENSNETFSDPDNSIVRVSPDVTLGTSNIIQGDKTFRANQYVNYTTKINDLSHAGQWRYKAEAIMSGTEKIVTDFVNFTVLD